MVINILPEKQTVIETGIHQYILSQTLFHLSDIPKITIFA